MEVILLWHEVTPSGMILDFEVEKLQFKDDKAATELKAHIDGVREKNKKTNERAKVLMQILII